jgi:hypothetical protein
MTASDDHIDAVVSQASVITIWHGKLFSQGRLLLVLRAFWRAPLKWIRCHVFIGNHAEDATDSGQESAVLVVRFHGEPGAFGRVGLFKHVVFAGSITAFK